MTNVMKEIILKEKLYDTGALYRSIQVYSEFTNPILLVNVVAEDYIKFYITERQLLRQLIEDPTFEIEVSGILSRFVKEKIETELFSNPDLTIPSYRLRVTFNGL